VLCAKQKDLFIGCTTTKALRTESGAQEKALAHPIKAQALLTFNLKLMGLKFKPYATSRDKNYSI
jgi:hypothetical protein